MRFFNKSIPRSYVSKQDRTDNNTKNEDNMLLAKLQNKYLKNYVNTQGTTYNTEYEYKVKQKQEVMFFSNILFWIYIVLGLICIMKLLFGNFSYFSFYKKLFMSILIVLFPFIISPIEMFVYKIFHFLWNLIFGNVNERSSYEYVIDFHYIYKLFKFW